MSHARILAVGFLIFIVRQAHADDAIAPETVAAIKRSSVFVRVEGDGWSGSGSGFVVAADKERVLVVTNHHVAVKHPPGAGPKASKISVVFGSGTVSEKEYPALVAASDEDRDLAVLRITGVKTLPKPIPYINPPKPTETMAVFSFGFPLGQALSGRKGFPAVTVGKASVSSLRETDDGELAVIQIDGNLNPGNSGGPVVDSKGRLVGVAVARARDGQGIGFLIPAVEVNRLLDGRIGRVRVVSGKGAEGKPIARVEAELLDPAGMFQTATAFYVIVPPKGKFPDGASLDKHPDARKLALKISQGMAAAEFALEKADGTVMVQLIGERTDGATSFTTRPRAYSLASIAKSVELATSPPAGWKEYRTPGKVFAVWLPEKPARQEVERRNTQLAGVTVTATGVVGKTGNGLVYRVETIDLPLALARFAARLYPAFRDTMREETKGRITESIEVKSGSLIGAEYRLESKSEVIRVRVYVQGRRIYTVRVVGTEEQMVSVEAETIVASFRRPGNSQANQPDQKPNGIAGKQPREISGGKEPTILGSIERDPKFKTIGPKGAVLIGVEARFAKFGGTEIIRGVRPIYRVNGKEEFGEQFGSDLTGAVTMKAKEGYAVGGVTGKAGWWCNGFALTYMKIKADGTLDLKDSYEGDWAGFNGKGDIIRVMSDGAPAIGIVGKIVRTETTAFGLLFKGQEEFDPHAKTK